MEKALFYGLSDVTLCDDFFLHYKNKIALEVIFDQWDILCNKKENAQGHSVVNFEICAGIKSGEFQGMVFQDSDFYKWLEAAGNILAKNKNAGADILAKDKREKLLGLVEYSIMLLEKSQQKDGYINTYFLLKQPNRKFTNLTDAHELYCAGHFFEAVVSVYSAIKSEKLLLIANRFATLLVNTFGEDIGQIRASDGHEEIELALIKLYELTKNEKYFQLACFFLNTRGTQPNFFVSEIEGNKGANIWSNWYQNDIRVDSGKLVYLQAHKPIAEQSEAVGHAVRVTYLMTAMAAAVQEKSDKLMKAVQNIWKNIVSTQMYITGGVGQTNIGEAFTKSYDLPNTTAYSETCAAIGMAMTAKRMLENEQNSCYAQILEREMFNGIISGISYDCKKYFYVNPLEVNPIRENMVGLEYVKQNRQEWHGCACCPPNLSRFLTSVETYIFSKLGRTLFVNQLISSTLNSGGDNVEICTVRGEKYSSTITIKQATNFDTIAIYVPQFVQNQLIAINHKVSPKIIDGFTYIKVKTNDKIVITGNVRPKFIRCNEKVTANAGKVAVMFGEFVMCCEQIDNGSNLHNLFIDEASPLEVVSYDPIMIKARGVKYIGGDMNLYFDEVKNPTIPQDIIFSPYYYWNNRSSGEMAVWINKSLF